MFLFHYWAHHCNFSFELLYTCDTAHYHLLHIWHFYLSPNEPGIQEPGWISAKVNSWSQKPGVVPVISIFFFSILTATYPSPKLFVSNLEQCLRQALSNCTCISKSRSGIKSHKRLKTDFFFYTKWKTKALQIIYTQFYSVQTNTLNQSPISN